MRKCGGRRISKRIGGGGSRESKLKRNHPSMHGFYHGEGRFDLGRGVALPMCFEVMEFWLGEGFFFVQAS